MTLHDSQFSYRREAWLTMLGLVVFFVLYVGLASWFSYTAYRMISGVMTGGDAAVAGVFAALPALFFSIFLWKALLLVRQNEPDPGIEIFASDQPRLFEFLHELADEVGAPRPHRVFVVPGVTAAVFHDVSLKNLFWPTQKNLLIGLGLVNALNRSEFKAVIAHEFGHFSQSSMAIGQWVSVGAKIASGTIHDRGWLDRVLDFISAIDLRVAWIGWIMRIIVWSIRSVFDFLFGWVMRWQRALSRKMEFEADDVAVSVTGSDAIVHALHRLKAADEDYGRALQFAHAQWTKKNWVPNVYPLQSAVTRNIGRVFGDPERGGEPTLPDVDQAKHRIFTVEIAAPPKMWATHPLNSQREENAKRNYLPSVVDSMSAWSHFDQAESLQTKATDRIFKDAERPEDLVPIPTSEAIARHDAELSGLRYAPRYQGVYLARAITVAYEEASLLWSDPSPRDQLSELLETLYPKSLGTLTRLRRQFAEEIEQLVAIRNGQADQSEQTIPFRGEQVDRGEVDELIRQVESEDESHLQQIEQHDLLCRNVHDAAARYVAHRWQDYHQSLIGLLHHFEHRQAKIARLHRELVDETNAAFFAGGGSIQAAKADDLLTIAKRLHDEWKQLDEQAEGLILPECISHRLSAASWREQIEPLKASRPTIESFGPWLGTVDGWFESYDGSLENLNSAILDQLLWCEDEIAQMHYGVKPTVMAPQPVTVPGGTVGEPRQIHRTRPMPRMSLWNRFRFAEGILPSTLRLVTAASVMLAVLATTLYVGNATVVVYNGLTIPVRTTIAGNSTTVYPKSSRSLDVGSTRRGVIQTRTTDGKEIETIDVAMGQGFATYIYNVGGAVPLVQWYAVYGNVAETGPTNLGLTKFQSTGAQHVFEKPPAQISSSGKGGTRSVVEAADDLHPAIILGLLDKESDRSDLIRLKSLWEKPGSRYLNDWLEMALGLPDGSQIIDRRLKTYPTDIAALRQQQFSAAEEDQDAITEAHRRLIQQYPDDPDAHYIWTRAMDEGPLKDAAFIAGAKKWPDHDWFQYATATTLEEQSRWQAAEEKYDTCVVTRGDRSDIAALGLARLRRYRSTEESPADLSDLMEFPLLNQLLDIESSNDSGFPFEHFLHLGEIQNAASWLAKQTDLDDFAKRRCRIFLGASVDAQADWIDQATSIAPSEIKALDELVYQMGLLLRLGKPIDESLEQFEVIRPPNIPALTGAVEALAHEADAKEIAESWNGLTAQLRGMMMVAAKIRFGDQAPESWQDDARRILFATERPALISSD